MPVIKALTKLQELDSLGTYLLLISPEAIPHLAIVSNGNYYSLTHKKAFVGEPFQPYLNFLKRAERKMIFIALKNCFLTPEATFERYDKANKNGNTCLYPVRDFVLPKSEANFVFELIPELYKEDKIQASFHLNMEKDLDGLGNFNLSTYSKEAIFSYIESLNEKYAKRS